MVWTCPSQRITYACIVAMELLLQDLKCVVEISEVNNSICFPSCKFQKFSSLFFFSSSFLFFYCCSCFDLIPWIVHTHCVIDHMWFQPFTRRMVDYLSVVGELVGAQKFLLWKCQDVSASDMFIHTDTEVPLKCLDCQTLYCLLWTKNGIVCLYVPTF